MRGRWWSKLVPVLAIIGSFLVAAPVVAENSTVTIGVGDTVLQVTGKTSPNAFVTINRDGSVIGTTVADAAGEFSQVFPAQTPGLHQLTVFAHTTGGHDTDTVSANVNITQHSTTVAHFFLPPTLLIGDTTLNRSQPLQLSGETYPGGIIAIYIDNSIYDTITANSTGSWTASIATGGLAGGQHSLFVRVTDGGGDQSYPTSLRSFSVAMPPGAPVFPPITGPIHSGLSAPRITHPLTDSTIRESSVDVQGTADANVQIELWDGDGVIGSVWSDITGRWSLNLRLDAREYNIRARACSGGVCSAFSPTVTFRYDPENLLSPTQLPLRITLERYHFSVQRNQQFTIEATVIDGTPPYTVNIDWDKDDRHTQQYPLNTFSVNHAYVRSGSYTVPVEVSDSQGRSNRVYVSVYVAGTLPLILIAIIVAVMLAALALLAGPQLVGISWLSKITLRK